MSQMADDTDAGSVAVIGMAARFPGAPDVRTFWENLRNGVESVTFFSDEELRRAGVDEVLLQDPNYVKAAAVLDDIASFDAAFFEIRDREAEIMDPQHRLFLECAWEAFEDAGYCPSNSRGAVGVYAGAGLSTYLLYNLSARLDRTGADFNLSTLIGNDKDYLATLVAYKFNLKGPAMAVQTACSTSLVAVHQACQGLVNCECDMALAGGVTVRVPHRVGYLHQGGSMLSPDGHCRVFDARAGGTLPGSGVGIVVLKRLADALEDQDRILAVIRGSAVNNDGAERIGFTAPSAAGQEKVIATAQAVAGVEARTITYMETHGTGTRLGDPIEVEALTRAFRRSTEARGFCAIGSVKSNFGHLEVAAGIAGLIKTVLALQHKQIPPSLHFEQANPEIDFDDSPAYLNTALREWKSTGVPLRAGVSSFGFGGTNAHLILEEAPASAPVVAEWSRPHHVLCLSARQPEALQALAGRYAGHLSGTEATRPADLTCTAHTGRAHFAWRLAVTGSDTAELARRLGAFAGGAPQAGIWSGHREAGARPKVAFLFTGQGSQYAHMGRQLYETQPLFRQELDRCEALLEGQLDRPLLAVLYPSTRAEAELVNQTGYTQPALFALEYALCRMWQSWGVEPEVVLGHSVGEYVAACVAGVLNIEDGLRLIATRGRLMQGLPGGGVMVSVLAEEERVEAALRGLEDRVSVAALNAPTSVVVSGASPAVEEVVSRLSAQGIETRFLQVSHAFHSPLMEPILEEFERLASAVSHGEPRLRLVSNLTGRVVDAGEVDGSYWVRHVREAVRFREGMSCAASLGCGVFLELGPQPVLCGLGRRCVADESVEWVGSLRRGVSDWVQLQESVARLYAAGGDLDWAAFEKPYGGRRVALPTYPFQRKKYWLARDNPFAARSAPKVDAASESAHPLVRARLRTAGRETIFQTELRPDRPDFLNDHQVHGKVIFPATGYWEMALAAAAEFRQDSAHRLENVALEEPLILDDDETRTVQVVLRAAPEPGSAFEIFSLDTAPSAADKGWRRHASGSLVPSSREKPPTPASIQELRQQCSRSIAVADHYSRMRVHGMDYGPAFQGIEELWCGAGQSLARLELPGHLAGDAECYILHPALLDACLQVLGANLTDGDEEVVYLPIALGQLEIWNRPCDSMWCHAVMHEPGTGAADTVSGDLRLLDHSGQVVAVLQKLYLKRATRQAILDATGEATAGWLHRLEWRRVEGPAADATAPPGSWLILADREGVGQALADRLRAAGGAATLVRPGAGNPAAGDDFLQVDALDPADFRRLLDEWSPPDGIRRGVIHLWGLDATPEERTTPESLRDDQQLECGSVLHLVQALADREGDKPRLLLITRGAQAVDQKVISPVQALLWGLGRVVASEHPDLRCTLVDLEPGEKKDMANIPLAELQADDPENQIAYRRDERYGARLVRWQDDGRAYPSADSLYQLQITARGVLDNLRLVEVPPQEPGPGEVKIDVRATGLNFRDVLNALGMYPGDPGPLGGECAGEVVAVGEGVTSLAVGQAVVAIAPGSFRSQVIAPAILVTPIPAGMSHEEAATLPITFLTAHHALNRIGRMAAGDKVLIHAGAGGVGQAAIQLARRAGAEIFATAGSPEKRDFLRTLGVQHVMDSRSLAFAEEIERATGGRGVDIVLNSLAGEFIHRGLDSLAPGGRFLEIGKIEILEADFIAANYPDISYHTVALDVLTAEEPRLVADMLDELLGAFAGGELKALPLRTFPIRDAVEAFRYMQQARHIGKIVVTQAASIRADGAYLITGGTGALGLQIARHFAARGAGALVLTGRREMTETAREQVAEMEAGGTRVIFARGDIADPVAAGKLPVVLAEQPFPLRGVVHTAGVLDDELLALQDLSRFEAVLAPKVAGTWNLHTLTRDVPLDFFILFSSVASLMGGAGQGNYAAANSFMDALAHERRRAGLPATSINWGAWAGSGMAARAEQLQRTWADLGIQMIEATDGLALLDQLLTRALAQVMVFPIDWAVFLARLPRGAQFPLLGELTQIRGATLQAVDDAAVPDDFLERLQEIPVGNRFRMVLDLVSEQALRVLGLSPSTQIDPRRPLHDLGLDSLMAVELRNALGNSFRDTLPATLLFDYGSVQGLAEYLAGEVLDLQAEAACEEENATDRTVSLEKEVEALSDEDVEKSLLDELDDVG